MDHPDRERIIAEIRGEIPPAVGPDRLGNVAEPQVVDNIRFPSKKEAKRYAELKLAERNGCVMGLRLQVTFPLVVNGIPIFPRGYRSDFTYIELQQDQWKSYKFVVEDCKPSDGFRTETYRIKKKLVFAIWGIDIRET